jgi:Tol biopolymer transport system component
VKDLISGRAQPLVTAPGYDGGPFFSNGENRLCYRSDRHGDSLLQVHVCDVVRDASGAITGTRNERQLTANEHVNWAPYWSPDDEVLIYASSEVGHDNYEIFEVSTAASDAPPVRARITHAPGADVLPVFDPSGRRMMWTSQRGPGKSSQLWIADLVTPHPPSASGAP